MAASNSGSNSNFTASVAANAGKTPYQILGVAANASQDEIRNAYRKLAKRHHPDLNPGNHEAEKHFKDISAAYERVGTSEDRRKFDRGEVDARADAERARGAGPQSERGPFYHQTQQGGGRYASSFEGFDDDFLSSIFGSGGAGGQARRRANPASPASLDQHYAMEIALKDSILGAEREITLPGGKRLRVKIPAGVESGAKLRFAGQGLPGESGQVGDAYVEIDVKPSSFFKRSGRDLEIEWPISLPEAVLGAEIRTPTIDGAILLKIPPGVSSGQKIRVPGKGVPSSEGRPRGDQYVVLKVVMPAAVDSEFRHAVGQWSRREPFNPRAELEIEPELRRET
jgi:DnaJ-class molecular chaperone